MKYFNNKPYIEIRNKRLTKKGWKEYIVRRFLKKKFCEICRKEFYARKNKTKYCSRECCLWRGGLTLRSNGYVWIKDRNHPSANKQGYVYLHRYIIEKEIGRKLESWEVVHHKDRNKRNNSLSNLIVMNEADHGRLHIKEMQSNRKYIKEKFHHINKDKCLHWTEL